MPPAPFRESAPHCWCRRASRLISANFPKDVRGRAIGTWAAASAITTALGPADRRVSHRPPVVAGGVLDQPAAGGDRGMAHLALRAGEPRRGRGGRHRLDRCGDRGGCLRRADLRPERDLGRAGEPRPHRRGDRRRPDRHCRLSVRRACRRQPDHAARHVPLEGLHQRQHRHRIPLRGARRRSVPAALRPAGAARAERRRRGAAATALRPHHRGVLPPDRRAGRHLWAAVLSGRRSIDGRPWLCRLCAQPGEYLDRGRACPSCWSPAAWRSRPRR